jgi:hypothetical protein
VRTKTVIMVISNFVQSQKTLLLILLQQAMTPLTPLEPGVEMFQRAKTQPLFSAALAVRSSLERPLSYVSTYTDIEDDDSSEFEEYSGSSVRCCNQCCKSLLTVAERQQAKPDHHLDIRGDTNTRR